jgi:hypothetical protein
MARQIQKSLRLILFVAVICGGVLAWQCFPSERSSAVHSPLVLEADRLSLVADGVAMARLSIRRADGFAIPAGQVRLTITEGERRARIESVFADGGAVRAIVRAGILPGRVVVAGHSGASKPVEVRLTTVLDTMDSTQDGTPDFLRLHEAGDREAFRRWFTFLAEVQAFRRPEELPREVNDCAALLRFAYRESLREHDGEWARALGLPALPGAPPVRKYAYPFTPLGAGLFRARPGSFRATDLRDGTFAQFADAETLRKLNAHFVTRDIRRAQPGDLLFYRQLEQNLPFHVMVFVGRSQLESGVLSWVVYHTGPAGESKGEMRRVSVDELLNHPSPRWRPLAGNPNFLGVYRWNILRQAD